MSTVDMIMDCLNRDIVMVWGNALLTDDLLLLLIFFFWGGGVVLNGVFCACLITLVSNRSVQNMVSVSPIPVLLICSAAYYSGLVAVQMVFEFISSPVTICSRSNNVPSFTLTKTGHVYHISKQYWPTDQYAMF